MRAPVRAMVPCTEGVLMATRRLLSRAAVRLAAVAARAVGEPGTCGTAEAPPGAGTFGALAGVGRLSAWVWAGFAGCGAGAGGKKYCQPIMMATETAMARKRLR